MIRVGTASVSVSAAMHRSSFGGTARLPHRHFASAASAKAPTPTWLPPLTTEGVDGTIGNTPLIRLKHVSRETGCEIYGKAEWMQPGGSVKDRAALYLVFGAEKSGLKKGGTIVEGTAGNTGIGLAHVCRARGYNCVIYMPNTQSPEKITALKMLGADVRAVPAVPWEDPANYNHQAREYAEKLNAENGPGSAVWTNQFDNTDNAFAHVQTTGPEIWAQMMGRLDGFICATGTGGTLAGTTQYLKAVNPNVQCYLADPPGSVLYNYVQALKEGKAKDGPIAFERTPGGSITEGIGQGRLTANLAPAVGLLDGSIMIPDAESIRMVYELLDGEGMFVGASSALNVVAARELAKKLGKGSRVVTIICDGAQRYQSRLFSKSWLETKGLWEAIPEMLRKYASLP